MKRRGNGEGSMCFSRGYWIAQISLPNGKRKKKYAKNQKDAKDWLLGQRNAIREAVWTETDSVTVSAFLDRYIEDIGSNTLRPKTIESYSSLVRLHIKPELGNIKLIALTPAQVQHLYTIKLNKGLSRRTVKYIHSVLHKALEQAVRWGLVVRNVCDLADPPKPTKPTHTVWDADQVKRFLAYVSEDRLYAFWVLTTTGMRLGELLGVRYEDVSWKAKTIHVTQAIQHINGQGTFITEPKTEKAKRTIKLPRFVFEVLKGHVNCHGITEGLLFTTKNGTPFSPRNVQRYFTEAIAAAGLPPIRFHDLRHTAATLLLKAETHPKLVQEMLGHSTISMTLDTYSAYIPAMHELAADKLDEILK